MKKNLLAALAIIVVILAIATPKIMSSTSKTSFCIKCHVMEKEYFELKRGAVHANVECVECHLPHDNAVHYFYFKTHSGIKDVISFYSGRVPEDIRASQSTKEVIEKNCRRCHGELVANVREDINFHCWDCHRTITHRTNGFMLTKQ
ncbi:MAG: cytochrome c nitrite reductase small subunit [Caldimicrobium thiodismutans]|uniref:Cytochrome c nitrite reductase small subunit n=1 Tax=Caldimicrobium thiodismutans TaxID=1653476 RepID=A0A2N7PJA1_9BACT|nr:MAG: cytochrome c nitrite reductase small subunit [Caldimicrobium thiodismutans]